MSNYTTIRTPNRPAVGTVRTANEWGAASNAAYLRVAFEPVKVGSSWAVTLEPCDAPAEREPTIAELCAEVQSLREEVRQMKARLGGKVSAPWGSVTYRIAGEATPRTGGL